MAEKKDHYDYVEHGTVDFKDLPPLDSETNEIMHDELRTGVSLTVFYFILIFSIPVMNWYFPAFAFKPIWGGMTVTWFITLLYDGNGIYFSYVHKNYMKSV